MFSILCDENSCRGKIRKRGGKEPPLVVQVRDSRDSDQDGGSGSSGQWGIMNIFEGRVTRFSSGLDVEGEIRQK